MGQQASKAEQRLREIERMEEHLRRVWAGWREFAVEEAQADVPPVPGTAIEAWNAACQQWELLEGERRAIMAHLSE